MAAVLSSTARALLTGHRVGRLATADAQGTPHVVPFCFALLEDVLYFVVDAKPKRRRGGAIKRMRNIAVNPAVAVVVDDYDEDWSRLAYVLVRGPARIVTDQDERTRALHALRAKYPQYRAMTLEGPDHPVVRIAIEHVHAWQAH